MAVFIVRHVDYQTLEPLTVGFAANLEIARKLARDSGLVDKAFVGGFECAYVHDVEQVRDHVFHGADFKFMKLDISATPGWDD